MVGSYEQPGVTGSPILEKQFKEIIGCIFQSTFLSRGRFRHTDVFDTQVCSQVFSVLSF